MRLNQNKDRDTMKDFRTELRIRQAEFDLLAIQSLSNATGIPGTTLWNRLNDPMSMRLSDIREIVRVLRPDPEIVLKAAGYTGTQIRRFKNG